MTDRGTYCTGGQTSGEVWTPPFEFAARLGDKNQEHCTVYNMIRLADYLGKPESWEMVRKVGDALADFHRRRVSHGNLKPGNIFFSGEERLMLADFAQGLMPGISELPYTEPGTFS